MGARAQVGSGTNQGASMTEMEKVEGMERRIEFSPAYDERKRDCGVHGAELRFYLVGPEGAVQFIVYTNWHLPQVQRDMDTRQDVQFPHLFHKPQPADIGCHSRKPMYEGQTMCRENCHLLHAPCYYDGSSLQAEDVFRILVEKGSDGVWAEMARRYANWLLAKAPT